MSPSSIPLGRVLRSLYWSTTDRQLQTIASVMAICKPMRIAPILLRRRALRIGRTSTSLDLELPGGLHPARLRSRIETRADRGRHGNRQNDDQHAAVDLRETIELHVLRNRREQRAVHGEAHRRESDPENAAHEADQPGLDQALQKNVQA